MADGAPSLTVDIFCTVVDNYGDVGVCWRLARQLAAEHAIQVRLWVDDLTSLQHIAPAMRFAEVEVRRWEKNFPIVEPADVVIEAFACELPASYIAAMVARKVKPVWINLEYLSAEDWVAGCHLGQSHHPTLPLIKHFFFPGFTPDTGGLIREKELGQDFDSTSFWQGFGLPQPQANELRISLFGYDNQSLENLLQCWAEGLQPVTCLVPQGALAEHAGRLFGTSRGNLRIHPFQFLTQDDYDRLLWACDCNFVRGEDSFVRAQWAARPFVWHIYPQQEDAHWPKLNAFLDLYCAGLPSAVESDLRNFWHAWNRGTPVNWADFWQHRVAVQRHANTWKTTISGREDLASSLVSFCKNKL